MNTIIDEVLFELDRNQISEAVKFNQNRAPDIGWLNYYDAIVEKVLKLNYSPDEWRFVEAVADWQNQNRLTSDGKIGIKTWDKMNRILQKANNNSTKNISINWPKGKGVFVRGVGSEKHGTKNVAQLVYEARQLGLTWVMLPGLLQYSQGPVDFTGKIKDFANGLNDVGIKPILWGWVVPSKWDIWLSKMEKALENSKINGIVVNAERDWISKNRSAKEFAQKISQIELPWALSSYGAPYFFKSFPWQDFVTNGNVCGMPQIYDSNHNQANNYPSRSSNAWLNYGYSPIIPTLGGSSKHSSNQMIDMFQRVRDQTGASSISWWSLDHLKRNPSRYNAVKNIRI